MGYFHVIQNLRLLPARKTLANLQLSDNLAKTDQVGDVLLTRGLSFLINRQTLLRFKTNIPSRQFNLHCFLVDRLKESPAELMINIQGRSNYPVNLIFED